MRHLVIAALGVAALLAPPAAQAGNTLTCVTFDIGTETSLPWSAGAGWRTPRADYPRDRVGEDTLALLTPERSVLTRMETLRRASVYLEGRPQQAEDLLARLMRRTLAAEADGKKDALAWFDAGYLAATLEQTSGLPSPVLATGSDGYQWVAHAIQERPDDPALHFAAALIRRESAKRPGVHLPRAQAGAAPGSLLARNLATLYGTPQRAASVGN